MYFKHISLRLQMEPFWGTFPSSKCIETCFSKRKKLEKEIMFYFHITLYLEDFYTHDYRHIVGAQ